MIRFCSFAEEGPVNWSQFLLPWRSSSISESELFLFKMSENELIFYTNETVVARRNVDDTNYKVKSDLWPHLSSQYVRVVDVLKLHRPDLIKKYAVFMGESG